MPLRLSPLRLQTLNRAQCSAASRPSQCLSMRSRAIVPSPQQAPQFRTYSSNTGNQANVFHKFINSTRTASAVLGIILTYGAYQYYSPSQPLQLDAPPNRPSESYAGDTKIEIAGKGQTIDIERVYTGTDAPAFFPKTIWIPRSDSEKNEGKSAALPAGTGAAQQEEEYQLLGLGIRTVTFIGIEVYVLGFYVAKADMGRLQKILLKAYMPEGSSATTLVQKEREDLAKLLRKGALGEKFWGEVLRNGEIKTAVRTAPTRAVRWPHLRDGWSKGIEARAKGPEFEGESFKSAFEEFKTLMSGGGAVGIGRVLLLARGAKGDLRIWIERTWPYPVGQDEGMVVNNDKMNLMGTVEDERISRLVWMGYLAGKKVSSEGARRSIIEGLLDLAERPLGTVETQVV